jgi:uroporphyrinogen-III synthase
MGLLQLPPGALIGTSSARRTAQILALRPDLRIVPLRGNVDTRLRKAQSEEYDAVILAAAGITRLGRAGEITEYLSFDQVLPDPGQGALAVQIRSDDTELESLVTKLDHAATRAAVTAERSFLRGLGGGCRMPIGAYAEQRDGRLFLRGVWASDPSPHMRRGEISGEPKDADALGQILAARLKRVDAPKQNALPLRSKRILVTRAQDQAETLLEKIRALGGEPVPFPTIDFSPLADFHELDSALTRASSFDWIVFTSANGVRHVVERLKQLGQVPQSIIKGSGARSPKLAAIGPATSRSLAELGLPVDFVPTKFLGEQIAAELPVDRGASALLLRADIASDVMARGLAARGVVVTDVDAYRTILPVAPDVDLSAIDAITFTSSSTVRNFLEMLDGKLEGLDAETVFCIGPVTAGTAHESGLGVDAVAAEHTVDGLISTMLKYYEELDNHA